MLIRVTRTFLVEHIMEYDTKTNIGDYLKEVSLNTLEIQGEEHEEVVLLIGKEIRSDPKVKNISTEKISNPQIIKIEKI